MKTGIRTILYLFVCLLLWSALTAQSEIKPEKFRTWIHQNGQLQSEGFLRFTTFDSLGLTAELYSSGANPITYYDVRNITIVKFRKRTSQGWGALIGLVAGATAGAILGAQIEGGDFCGGKCGGTAPGTLAILGGIGGGMVGASVGLAIGSRKKKVHINGRLTPGALAQIQPYVIPDRY